VSTGLPLAGLRVVDFGIGGVGPWAGSQLGQLGATVVKVEAPNEFILSVKPPWHGLTTTYASLNVAKRSVRLNLKEEQDMRRAWRLLEDADVVIENFRSGAIDRLGLGFDAVAERNPRVVFCSASGFGSRGEMAGLPCMDPQMQAFSGLAAINGAGERMRYYAAIDLYTAAVIVEAVLAALLERERTGMPQHIEMTMLGAATTLLITQSAEVVAGGGSPRPLGSRGGHVAPDGVYSTSDGALALTADGDSAFAALSIAIDRGDLAGEARFRGRAARLAAAGELDAILTEALSRRPTEAWLHVLRQAGVPCSPVHLDHEVIARKDVWEQGHLRELEVDGEGTLDAAGPPWDFQGVTPAHARVSKPGQDTELLFGNGGDPWAAIA
jgi:crotonobetainyl-CoA:carnitine CoA-transferase CaiB-like acyl-CoA transferase